MIYSLRWDAFLFFSSFVMSQNVFYETGSVTIMILKKSAHDTILGPSTRANDLSPFKRYGTLFSNHDSMMVYVFYRMHIF